MHMRMKKVRRLMAGFMSLAIAVPLIFGGSGLTHVKAAQQENYALGKTVTANPVLEVGAEALALVTDGRIQRGWENSLCYRTVEETEDTTIRPWIQIDLGESHEITRIHYTGVLAPDVGYDNQSHNVVIQLSNDETFTDGTELTVYNSDSNNFFGLGSGTDGNITNTESGTSIEFEPVNARYLRYYQHGAFQPNNHTWPNALTACEIEVYGPEEEVVLDGKNLSLDAEASASSLYPGYSADAVADGDKGTNWACAGGDYNQGHSPWVMLTWDYLVEINGVNLVDRGNATDAIPDGLLEWGTEEGVTA